MTDWLLTEEEKNVAVRAIEKAVNDSCPGRDLYFIAILGSRERANEKLDLLSNVHPSVQDDVIKSIAGQTPVFEGKMEPH